MVKHKKSLYHRRVGKKIYPVTCPNCKTITKISLVEINLKSNGDKMGFICKSCCKLSKLDKPITKVEKIKELRQ